MLGMQTFHLVFCTLYNQPTIPNRSKLRVEEGWEICCERNAEVHYEDVYPRPILSV